MRVSHSLGRVSRPEYTGENRCLPCTVVNVLLAAALGVALSALTPVVGVGAFLASLVVVYLRGYLVPGTPELTERYLPASVLALFGKERVEPTVRADATDREAGVELLTDAGVFTRDGTAPPLSEGFRAAWHDRMAAWDGGDPEESVARLFDAESVDAKSERSFVVDGNAMVRWPSRAALLADVTAGAELRARIEGWEMLDRSTRQDLLTALRLSLVTCPACDGPVETETLTDDPCCQPEYTAYDAACTDCETPIASATVRGEDDGTPPGRRVLDA
ncbi:hypothetical protein [Halomarina litorea]|uniref:hypothetical protein n=1 Tax=Halomarina litorea TaxID=2961595 RepID=UPI0020C32E60|nr:hypothetical protein [Halomarina sp. BCD28]